MYETAISPIHSVAIELTEASGEGVHLERLRKGHVSPRSKSFHTRKFIVFFNHDEDRKHGKRWRRANEGN